MYGLKSVVKKERVSYAFGELVSIKSEEDPQRPGRGGKARSFSASAARRGASAMARRERCRREGVSEAALREKRERKRERERTLTGERR